MRTSPQRFAVLLLVLFAAIVPAAAGQQPAPDRDPMEDLVIPAGELAADIEKGTTIIGDNLAPADPSASFTSQVIEAPIPFNAVVPHWTGTNAEAIELRVRTGPDGVTWGEWIAVHANHDWMEPGEPEIVGEMVLVAEARTTHRFVQVQVLFDEAGGEAAETTGPPTLSQLRLTFIDTHDGPTADELLDLQTELDKDAPLLPEDLTTYPKPFVVSRDAWCIADDCDYTEGLEYHPVSHLIVHHTVSNNSSTDWAAVVRAIWNFHTYSRGWGDIGYNYLVDPNGVLYEGHNGGDDVVGTHSSGANTGSMALALLGTFTAADHPLPGIRPPDAMLASAVELLAWKADQRDINIFDAGSELPDIDWGLPHLMGHRDVYGTTECPGDQAHLLIPWLREQIAAKIGLTDPFIYADDQTTAFVKSSEGDWFTPPYLCGYNNHAWYTWSVDNPASSDNWGEWRPNVPAAGRYRIDAYAPYCKTGESETGSATYTIWHAGGTTTKTISHEDNVGLWTSLGEYDLNQGNGNLIRLTDLTSDSALGVWFDALRLLPVDAPPPVPVPNNVDPAAEVWKNKRQVTFAWQVLNPSTVEVTTLQVATDPAFSNVLVNQSWFGAPTTATHTFSMDHSHLYWRVLLASPGVPLVSSLPTHFRLDATPPISTVSMPLHFLPRTGNFVVDWSGSDALAGVDRYHIDFRPQGGQWTRWLSDTKLTSAVFTPPASGVVYEFRSQAIDVAGNVESLSEAPDATTSGAAVLNQWLLLPAAFRN